ncbi:2-keto-4-pentenoate hydratase [Rubricella aquisinus]|uniref:2-keto-4-pentenoate hydratase n=1 Tax=Rubricella aquisinus TaxID=2028108 RepID=A0A840X139_9RHOB|nr:fumarylacetoacetate hydrolase family protein [Rubricella aquisinus]MBB5514377.1 2-keto-4-pentenoate hydratase [Rubricella aquisinus]
MDIESLTNRIYHAERDATPIATLAADIGTPERGYAIQRQLIARAMQDGRALAGRKIGLTSKLVQEQLGVHEPVHGPIFVDRVLRSGVTLDAAAFIAPKVEPELAFTFSQDVTEPGLSRAALTKHITHVTAAIEIVDSRITDWGFALPDMIADYAVSARVILGDRQVALEGIDLTTLGVRAMRNGDEVGTGTGAACLDHPLNALGWLADALIAIGEPLRAGQIVITGSLTPVLPLATGDHYAADFDHLGSVTFSIA